MGSGCRGGRAACLDLNSVKGRGAGLSGVGDGGGDRDRDNEGWTVEGPPKVGRAANCC